MLILKFPSERNNNSLGTNIIACYESVRVGNFAIPPEEEVLTSNILPIPNLWYEKYPEIKSPSSQSPYWYKMLNFAAMKKLFKIK